jgi:hypothetical protein
MPATAPPVPVGEPPAPATPLPPVSEAPAEPPAPPVAPAAPPAPPDPPPPVTFRICEGEQASKAVPMTAKAGIHRIQLI